MKETFTGKFGWTAFFILGMIFNVILNMLEGIHNIFFYMLAHAIFFILAAVVCQLIWNKFFVEKI